MAFLDTDDTGFAVDTGEQTRRPIRRLPKPMIRLIMLVVAVVVLVVIIVVSARSCSGGVDAAEYNRYMLAVADILKRSDAVGAQVDQLLTNPGDTNRTEIQTKLDSFTTTCEGLETEAQALEVPKDLYDAHQMFLVVMTFRQKGISKLKPAIIGALDVQDVDVPAETIAHALRYLTASDTLYAEVFLPKSSEILQKDEVSGVQAPSSQFLSDPEIASKTAVLEMLTTLKSTGVLQAVHGVALEKVVALPDDKEITSGSTYNLTSTDELEFEVTVENQGNMDETDVKVTVTLTSQSAEPQEVTVEIPSIKAKAQAKVTVDSLDPTPYGEIALLRVQAGPVPNEKNSDNNWLEANVIFKM
jgi:hypothetical protein